jgi:hypothetical protein
MKPIVLLGAVGVLAYVVAHKQKTAGAFVPFPSAGVPVDPEVPADFTDANTKLNTQIVFNIQTAQAHTLSLGESVIGSTVGIGGALAANSATGVLLFSATSWTIVGGIIAGVFALVAALRSETHKYASVLVDKYENPFGNYFIQAQQSTQRGIGDGSLGADDVKQVYNGVYVAWGNYKAAMDDLIRRGGDWEIVAKQSLNNLNNEYKGERLSNGKVLGVGMGGAFPDGFINFWFAWYEQQVAQLEAGG